MQLFSNQGILFFGASNGISVVNCIVDSFSAKLIPTWTRMSPLTSTGPTLTAGMITFPTSITDQNGDS